DCTKNHIWILGGERNNLRVYNYSKGNENPSVDGSCNLPNANSGLWVEDNEKYFWRTEYKGSLEVPNEIFLYRYRYNNSECFLESNFSLTDFNISITGPSRGITGDTNAGKLWLGVNRGDELTGGNVYEFNIIPDEEDKEINKSTGPKNNSLIITNSSWKNIISVASLNVPIIVSNSINNQINHYIKRYNPSKVYLIGNNDYGLEEKTTKINKLENVPKILYPDRKGIFVDSIKKGVIGSGISRLTKRPVVFDKESGVFLDLQEMSYKKAMDYYIKKIKEKNRNINFLIVSDNDYPLSGVMMGRKNAYPVLVDGNRTGDTAFIKEEIGKSVSRLEREGFYTNAPRYSLRGAHMLLMGEIESIQKKDPVENLPFLNDPVDGAKFRSDLEYGDLDNDTTIDVSVGRFPKNETLSSLMISRPYIPRNDKRGLVASEYLYTAWPVILSYIGGGMWNGKTISNILKERNFKISRLVEHRARPVQFLSELAPVSIKSFLDESEKIGEKLNTLLGHNIGNTVSHALTSIKALKYAEEGLEMYLEYDWSTFGPKRSNAKKLLKPAAKEKNPQKLAMKLVYILWPERYPKLNVKNLKEEMKNKDLIYYEGIGNGTEWILPNPIRTGGYLDWQEFLQERYSGENTFSYGDIPELRSRIVWDNSNLATQKNKEMWKTFLNKGSTTFIGASGVNYVPYSSQIDTSFFKEGGTIGQALINSVNDYREEYITYDPFNMFTRGSQIKEKILREFILYGDPSLKKNPLLTKDGHIQKEVSCGDTCQLEVGIDIPHRVVGNNESKTIITESDEYLVNSFEPILPIKEFEYYLPDNSRVINYTIERNKKTYKNIEFPNLDPLDHGNNVLNNTTTQDGEYPEKTSRLNISKTIDNRTKIELIHSIVNYNQKTKEADVFNQINLHLNYITPLEMEILPQTNKEEIKIKIINNMQKEVDGTLLTEIINNTRRKSIQRNFSLGPKKTRTLKIDIKQNKKFQVKSLTIANEIKVGPRERVFEISSDMNSFPYNFIKVTSEKIVKLYRNFKNDIELIFKPTKVKFEDKNPKSELTQIQKDDKEKTRLIHPNFTLTITKTSKYVKHNLTTSQGKMIVIKEQGNVKERIDGNKDSLKEKYKLAKELIKNKIKQK
ncbi:MAG: hypothetical protein ABEK36_06505, partial [Candidatus Aenigmatarchaeota archaeon]